MAEGRGGVVKLSFITDLVSTLQPTRGMKRRRFIYNPKTSKDYRRELRRKPHEALLWSALKGRNFSTVRNGKNSIRIELQELDHTTPAFGHPSSC